MYALVLKIEQVVIIIDILSEMTDAVPAEIPAKETEDMEKVAKMEAGDFSGEDLRSFERPRNMFDVTDMTYEEYVEKHYEIMGRNMKEKMVQQQMMQMQMMMKQQMGSMGGMGAGGYGGFGVGVGGSMGFGQGGGNRFGGSVHQGLDLPWLL